MTRGGIPAEMERIRSLSARIEKRMRDTKTERIDCLTAEELQDLHRIVGIADFVLSKYEGKKEMHSILRHFAQVIEDAARSLEEIDDEISEMILNAEDSLGKIKDMHVRISSKSDLRRGYRDGPEYDRYETSEDGIRESAMRDAESDRVLV